MDSNQKSMFRKNMIKLGFAIVLVFSFRNILNGSYSYLIQPIFCLVGGYILSEI